MASSSSGFPSGYRFLPTDGELVAYYLARQMARISSPSNPISELQIYNYSPDAIFKNHNLSEDDQGYFFSSRMKRYNGGTRPNRTAGAGFWKATGATTDVTYKNRIVGSKTSLVYNIGKPSKSPTKTNWLMTEYQIKQNGPVASNEGMLLDKWVLCKIYRGNRSSSETSKKDLNVHVVTKEVKKDQQKLAYEEPASLLHAPVSQSDEMTQFSQEAGLLLNGEQRDPQLSPYEQINPILDLDKMTVDEVNQYFQESESTFNGTLTSQADPQSSYGGPNNLKYDFPIFYPEPDFLFAQMCSTSFLDFV